ncbi:hypothetical protein RHOFW510R12_27285 [Rhodanobacter sp. FW510-R12]|uniref:hypothetical protein n=1 Tax=unclassified Rhodanobacter TaxID=2621553 RepID=UPI0007AA41A6|nr:MULTISPECIES: hypothetical protein [unclassified Rhodanobacter]KZC17533.1 hypothetical protein RHOFW104R8_10490 [Rhodanobacter sp. FW104-R8]KZC28774.1 hypothetical protein RhoFW510T8_09900 [Rhodanobacter sp. FW510-T8]KZC33103.1 hypothetical protein RhoFW510R10_09350 [Rhodanobacter sp. FW510-R10]
MVIDAVWTVQASVFLAHANICRISVALTVQMNIFWLLLPAFDVTINRSSDNTGWKVSQPTRSIAVVDGALKRLRSKYVNECDAGVQLQRIIPQVGEKQGGLIVRSREFRTTLPRYVGDQQRLRSRPIEMPASHVDGDQPVPQVMQPTEVSFHASADPSFFPNPGRSCA